MFLALLIRLHIAGGAKRKHEENSIASLCSSLQDSNSQLKDMYCIMQAQSQHMFPIYGRDYEVLKDKKIAVQKEKDKLSQEISLMKKQVSGNSVAKLSN